MRDDLGMMTFQEQLEIYPPIREMLLRNVRNPAQLRGVGLPWRVYGQKTSGGSWARKDFRKYKEAFQFLKPRLKTYHDISITSKRLSFPIPGRVVRIRRNGRPLMVKTKQGLVQQTRMVPVRPPPDHLWCLYCRRFTIFTWFSAHHAFRGENKEGYDPSLRRCFICGGREGFAAWLR